MLRKWSDAADNGETPEALGRERVWTGLVVLVVLTAGAYLPSALYPVYQETFELSDLSITLVFATFALVSAPALLLLGPASDAVGPRRMLRVSIVLAAAGSACFAVASGPLWLVAGRAAQGLALGAATGAAGALISEGAGRRLRVSGAVPASIAFVSGTAAGPVMGGAFAQYLPAPHVLPYLVHMTLLGIGWHRVSALPGHVPRRCRWRPTRPEIPRGMRLLFTAAATTGFLAWTVAGVFLAVIPVLLTRVAGANLAVTGGILGTVLLCSAVTQPLVQRIGVRYAQLTGLAALLVGLGAVSGTGGGSPAITLAAALAAGAGHGLAYGGAAAAVDAVAPPGKRGGITGALYLAFYLGSACPAVAIGLVTPAHPLSTATAWVTAVAAALVPLAGAAVALVRHPDVRSRAPATGGSPAQR